MTNQEVSILFIDNIENIKSVIENKFQTPLTQESLTKYKIDVNEVSILGSEGVDIVLYNPTNLSTEDLGYLSNRFLKNNAALLYVVIQNRNLKSLVEIIATWKFEEKYKLLYKEFHLNNFTNYFAENLSPERIKFIITNSNVKIEDNSLKFEDINEFLEKSSKMIFLKSLCDYQRELVANNDVLKSLNSLKLYFDQSKIYDSRDNTVILKASYGRVKQSWELGLISFEEKEKSLNRIAFSLLEIIKEKI